MFEEYTRCYNAAIRESLKALWMLYYNNTRGWVGMIGPKARTEQQVIGLPGIELFLPVVVGVHVSRGQVFSALEDVHAAKETGCFFLLSCGELLSLYS